ncbi:hypothetical protein K438DRAFT_1989288 [Mycena galopus ATCC 62051]|nr:hypothetical protein K438DRAFT_1989288 [Mycena galopus ATCC 62051]
MSPAVSPVAQALSPAPAWPCRLVAHARLAVSHVQTLFLPRRPGLLHRVAPARSAMSPALNPVALALSPRTAAPRPFVDTTLCRPWPVNRAALSRFVASSPMPPGPLRCVVHAGRPRRLRALSPLCAALVHWITLLPTRARRSAESTPSAAS